jgi:hypothetical protein
MAMALVRASGLNSRRALGQPLRVRCSWRPELFGFFEITIRRRCSRLDAALQWSGSRRIGTLLMALTFTLASVVAPPFIGTLLVTAGGTDPGPLVRMLAF